MQYTLIEDITNKKFVPLWRRQDGDVWEEFYDAFTGRISYETRQEALDYIARQEAIDQEIKDGGY